MTQYLLDLPQSCEDRRAVCLPPRRPQPLRAEAEDLLRDIAYVLHWTRQVREEIELSDER
jgi:hypothetical protein